MIRASKVRAVARFEFGTAVRRKAFILVTFGLPIFFASVGGGLGVIQTKFLVDQMNIVGVAGVVDESGVLADEPIWEEVSELDDEHRTLTESRGVTTPVLGVEKTVFALYADRDAAIAAVLDETLDQGAYVIPDDYIATGTVLFYDRDATGAMGAARRATVDPALARLIRDRILRNVASDEIRERILSPLDIEGVVVSPGGAERSDDKRSLETLFRVGVPFFLGMFLLTALLFSSGYLVQTVALDKESKIIEVLLSSADPDEILLGKLLGLGGAGLLQFFVWSGMVLLGASSAAQTLTALEIELPWLALSFAPVLFVLGYLFIGSLMLATGSLGSGIAESQKLTMGWALLALAPMFVLVMLIEEPGGTLARVMSIVPFSSPLTLIVRLSIDPDGVPIWEIILSVTVLLLSTWAAIRLGARLFRLGILMTGSRPSWREIARQMRLDR
ncbi:MAG: ABC transporter permease [Polyangiales bacterium]